MKLIIHQNVRVIVVVVVVVVSVVVVVAVVVVVVVVAINVMVTRRKKYLVPIVKMKNLLVLRDKKKFSNEKNPKTLPFFRSIKIVI